MFYFFERNWKYLAYPITVVFIILFDWFRDIPFFIFTLPKLFMFSVLHYLVVLRTKHVFDSDITRYYGQLKYIKEQHDIMSPLLSPLVYKTLFFLYFFVALFLLQSTNPVLVALWHSSFFCLFTTNFGVEVYRAATNTADLSVVPEPKSLIGTIPRRCLSGLIRMFTKFGAACATSAPGFVSVGGFVEVGFPTLTGSLNEAGPLTRYYVNNHLYDDLACPVETRADIAYESVWHGMERDVYEGRREFNTLPKRNINIRNPQDLMQLGGKDLFDQKGFYLPFHKADK